MASSGGQNAPGRQREARSFVDRQAELFAAGFSFSGYERDLVALNRGDGRFLDISGASGADSVGDGRGAAFADLDNDHDMDVVLTAMHGPSLLLMRNRVGQDSGAIRIALQGTKSGRDAFGAVVRVETSAGVLTQVKSGGSGFLSQSDPRLLFGLGTDTGARWIEVSWPSGLRQRFTGPAAGASLLIVEGEAEPRPVEQRRHRLPDPSPPARRRSGAVRALLGQRLPPVVIQNLDGEPGTLSAVLEPGRPALLNLWATWCRPCAAEMAALEQLHLGAGESGPRVVGVSVDGDDTRGRIVPFLERVGVTYPVYAMDPAELEKLFSTRDVGIPISIVLDAGLRVVDVIEGWSEKTRQRLEKLSSPAE